MKLGDTFKIPQPGTSLDSHLWVVLSDPVQDASSILIVNFTSKRADSDLACVLAKGEHPFVQHETCVNYAGAKVVSAANIEKLLAKGLLQPHAAVSKELLTKILEGAAASQRMSLDHADILINQGLIEC